MRSTEEMLSLERYINRKRLFVRVQANVNRELFIAKLNAAFPGARIGVGNANAERGPVTQRVADINYDSAAEATQALRRNRFKLRVGNHDADITYQIERKDVVERLAGEWGCRFMVVVKNLPPGEISCAELSEMFEAAGEIFTIKILPGNRGEPYALVQYVEEQSVELSIQQMNQQKLHGAVLYVERHLKARRQNTQAAPLPAPAAPAPPATQPTQHTQPNGMTTIATSRAPTAAAAVAGGPPRTAAAAVAGTAHQQHQQHTPPATAAQAVAGTAGTASTAISQPATQPPPASQQPPSTLQIQSQSSLPSPLSPTSAASQSGVPPITPSSQPPKPAVDTTSLFSQYVGLNKQDSLQLPNGNTPSAASDSSRLNIFSTGNDILGQSAFSSAANTAGSPQGLLGGAGVSAAALRTAPSGQGLGLLGQSPALGSLANPSTTITQQVLTPTLDLFSHLREPSQSSGGALPSPHDSLSNGLSNGHGLQSSTAGYANMVLRNSPPGAGPTTPSGILSPTANGANKSMFAAGNTNAVSQATSLLTNTVAAALGARAGPAAQSPAAGQPLSLLTNTLTTHSQQASASLASPVAQQQQHNTGPAAGATGAVNLGMARISIRDSLRLALGRLEELVTCPITNDIMREPVVAADGYTYERHAIQSWQASSDASPVTGLLFQHKLLVTNKLAAEIIEDILPQP